ncbi:MAG: hypothetical protein ACYC9S_08940 [Leptospirales bacterium]
MPHELVRAPRESTVLIESNYSEDSVREGERCFLETFNIAPVSEEELLLGMMIFLEEVL